MGATDGSQRINRGEEYKKAFEHWEVNETKLKARFIVNAWLRLMAFVAAFSLPFLLFENWSGSFFAVFIICFASFLWLVWRANQISSERKYVGHRMALLKKELNALKQRWTEESDGSELIEPDHDYAHDLDLFGKGSLFQYINRTSTKGGYIQLANKLKNISLDKGDITNKQKAVAELTPLNEFRQHFYALGALVAEGNKRNHKFNLDKQPDLSFISRGIKIGISAFLVFIVVAIVAVVFNVWSANVIAYVFFLGLGLVGLFLKKINKVHGEVASLGNYLYRYSKLIKYVESSEVKSEYLLKIKAGLTIEGKQASEVMLMLAKNIKLFDQRLNMLLGVLLNGFFLWDLIVCFKLQKWYSSYGGELNKWLDALHELEAMNSFATFAYNHPGFIYPELDNSTIFSAKELGHPLIPDGERVSNDFQFAEQQRICVVTGANMAGKSTFLRTVGVAMVLAGNGCVVAANEFTYKPMPFVTNMRAIDNLLKHESYFFAELSRLQMILNRLKEDGELFFILDEILKGTNSLDKYQGSMALIKQLLKHNGCGLVATHDLELGQLEKQTNQQVFNNCFEVSFDAEGLSFDYKLRTGVTESHNATYLMEKMGLIPSENVRH